MGFFPAKTTPKNLDLDLALWDQFGRENPGLIAEKKYGMFEKRKKNLQKYHQNSICSGAL